MPFSTVVVRIEEGSLFGCATPKIRFQEKGQPDIEKLYLELVHASPSFNDTPPGRGTAPTPALKTC